MTKINSQADALKAGFTRELFASSSEVDFYLLAKPDADLDGTFEAWDDDGGELIRVNGWLFTIHPATGFIDAGEGILRRA